MSVCRSVWALVEIGRSVTFEKVLEATGRPHTATRPYVDLLLRHGYVSLVGTSSAVGGEAVCEFAVINRTGPKAPFVNEGGEFVDPNLPPPKPDNRGRMTEMPSLTARVRFIAEQLGQFTRQDLECAVGVECREPRRLPRVISQLRKRGDIQGPLDGVMTVRRDAVLDALRQYFRDHLGEEILAKDLWPLAWDKPLSGPTIRQAVNMLAAEGWRVTLEQRTTRQQTVYRVDPPAGGAHEAP